VFCMVAVTVVGLLGLEILLMGLGLALGNKVWLIVGSGLDVVQFGDARA